MMWSTRLTVVALVVAGRTVSAQAADGSGKGLDLCIETARGADATCSKLADDPAQRLECFQKARAVQLECLEQALPDPPTGTTASESHPETSQPGQPAATASPDAPAQAASSQDNSQENARKDSQEKATGSTQSSNKADASEPPGGSTSPKEPASTAEATPVAIPSPRPSATPAAESTTAAVQADTPKITTPKMTTPKTNEPQARPPESRWLVSETTSPVDYSPLLTAVIRPTSSSPGGPVSLAVRCWGGQTELLIRTEGTWHATRRNALPVDFQINDQSAARQTWTLSADAKIATYADDTVELLRSLPDGARLSVSVQDGADVHQQASFLLTGWNAVRKRIEVACKWPEATEQASSGKR